MASQGKDFGSRRRPSILRRRKQAVSNKNVNAISDFVGFGSSSMTSFQFNFLDHCVFCLRKTKPSGPSGVTYFNTAEGCPDLNETLHVVPSAEIPFSSTLLDTLNGIWSSLQTNNLNGETEHDLAFLESSDIDSKIGGKQNLFTSLPKMCRFCAHQFVAVDKLMTELKAQVNSLRRVIRESKYGGKYSWRASEFETELRNSNMEEGSILTTLSTLGDLGKPPVTPVSIADPLETFSRITVTGLEATSNTFILQDQSDNHNSKFNFMGDGGGSSSESVKSEDNKLFSEVDDDDQNELDISCEVVLGTDEDETTTFDPLHCDSPIVASSSHPTRSPTADLRCDEELGEDSDEEAADSDYIKSENESESETTSDDDSIKSEQQVNINPNANLQSNRRPRKQKFAEIKEPSSPDNKRPCRPGESERKITRRRRKGGPYTCDQCNSTFPSKKAHYHHQQQEHPKVNQINSQKCDLCQDRVQLTSIIDHLQSHIGKEYIIKCPNAKCRRVFSQYRTLFYHIQGSKRCKKRVSKDPKFSILTYICDICGFTTPMAITLRSHLLEEHETPEKHFPCPVDHCEHQFTEKQSVAFHLPLHDYRCNPKSQRCSKCSEDIKVEEMETHMETMHQIKDTIKCTHCPFIFLSREDLIDHLFIHRYSVLSCDLCTDQMKFTRHKDLREHYFNQHKIGVQFSCEHCGALLFNLESLKTHVRVYHSETPRDKTTPFMCEECGVTYGTRRALRDHNIEAHGAKPYCCGFCSETFTKQDLLNRHVKAHKGVPEYKEVKCEVAGCGKIFKKGSQLKEHHSVWHGDKKEYVCGTCGKEFSNKQGLKHHNDFVHLGLRPHVCETCGEGFGTKNVLRKHMMIHTGEKAFQCEICSQKFRYKEVLQRHVEGHEKKGTEFKPNGPMKNTRKRVEKEGF